MIYKAWDAVHAARGMEFGSDANGMTAFVALSVFLGKTEYYTRLLGRFGLPRNPSWIRIRIERVTRLT